ncbi:hypothetical protein [Armatimonas sp.]|uniref:hypothetical protein n=1 Tax=Armatimonas sp. TaxID=1872638 RepID=UPI00286A8AF6|nr:hypothetical protein [Armatimonas sp.]
METSAARTSIDREHRFRLPSPDTEALTSFVQLWESKMGTVLTEQEAARLAAQVLQLVYLKNFGTHPGCTPKLLSSNDPYP